MTQLIDDVSKLTDVLITINKEDYTEICFEKQ